MKITARGWSRNMGDNVIADIDLTEATYSRDPNRRISYGGDPTVFRTAGGVSIDWGKRVTLSGSYRWEVELTTDEIIGLFKKKVGSELHVELLEEHGFTVSEEFQKKVLSGIKLADLTIGDLAKLSGGSPSAQSSTPPSPAPAPVPARVSLFRRRV
jgi:hypothetical protein